MIFILKTGFGSTFHETNLNLVGRSETRFAKDTVDSRVAEILLWKLESMGNLQGDSTKDFEEILSAIQGKSVRGSSAGHHISPDKSGSRDF